MVRKGMVLALFLLLGTMSAFAADPKGRQTKKSEPPTYTQVTNPDGSLVIYLTIKSPDYKVLEKMAPAEGVAPSDGGIGMPQVPEGNYILAGTYDTSKGGAEKLLAELVEAEEDFSIASEVVTIPGTGKFGRRVLIRYDTGGEYDRILDYLEEHNRRTKDNIRPYVIVKRAEGDTFSKIQEVEEKFKELVQTVVEPSVESKAKSKNSELPYYEAVVANLAQHGMATTKYIALTYAMMYTESHMNPEAISDAGAIGILQVMPKSAFEMDHTYEERKKISFWARKRKLEWYEQELRKPEVNIAYAVRHMANARKRFGDDIVKIAADYNGGGSHVHNPLPETIEYIKKVKKILPKKLEQVANKQ